MEEELNGAHELGKSRRKKLGKNCKGDKRDPICKRRKKRPSRLQPKEEGDPFHLYDQNGKIKLLSARYVLIHSKLPKETINQIMRFVFQITDETQETLLLSRKDFERAVILTSMVLRRQGENIGGVEEVTDQLLSNLSVVEDNLAALDCNKILRRWSRNPDYNWKCSPIMLIRDLEGLERSKKDACSSSTLDDEIAKDEDSNKKTIILPNES